jgi:hypothetical protein
MIFISRIEKYETNLLFVFPLVASISSNFTFGFILEEEKVFHREGVK